MALRLALVGACVSPLWAVPANASIYWAAADGVSRAANNGTGVERGVFAYGGAAAVDPAATNRHVIFSVPGNVVARYEIPSVGGCIPRCHGKDV